MILIACALPQLAWSQLMFRTTLNGANEVPARMTPAWGIGHATLDLDSKMFSFEYTFEGLLAPQTAAHIHVAPPGVNGGVLIPLPNGSPSGIDTVLTDMDIEQLRGGLWYVNVHSELYPGGEIRGQFVPVPEASTYAMGAALVLGLALLRRHRNSRLAQSTA
ncbi:MAG TPA: CHRD domain-containing protein [Opitutus sp.]|nr:CHRD domain-containing protein [Opitutus sp.]